MRGILGVCTGFVCSLLVIGFVWNPELIYPFSEEWSEWEVASNVSGPQYKTSLKWYPLVECTIVPRVIAGAPTMARIDIRWSGLSMLPLLTPSGLARLDYECVQHFTTVYLR